MTAKFLAGIGFWGGLGWWLDQLLGIFPVLFTIGTMLGLGAALYLMWLTTDAGQDARVRGRSSRTDVAPPHDTPTDDTTEDLR